MNEIKVLGKLKKTGKKCVICGREIVERRVQVNDRKPHLATNLGYMANHGWRNMVGKRVMQEVFGIDKDKLIVLCCCCYKKFFSDLRTISDKHFYDSEFGKGLVIKSLQNGASEDRRTNYNKMICDALECKPNRAKFDEVRQTV